MAKLDDTPLWSDVYQLEQTDPVIGGTPNPATGAGMDNIPHLQLAQRTSWLKEAVDTLVTTVVAASTTVAGLVKLSTATNSTSTTTAATPSAVKAVNDNAETRALKSTTLTAGDGLIGGGNLSANRTLAVDGSVVRTARTVVGAGLATGGGDLSADRTITVPDATQAEAEAGTITSKAMSPLRVAQAIAATIAAYVPATRTIGTGDGLTGGGNLSANRNFTVDGTVVRTARTVLGAGLATGGGSLAADRVITVADATQAEAEAGTSSSKAMSPLRVAQAIAKAFSGVVKIGNQVIVGEGGGAVALTVNDGGGNANLTFNHTSAVPDQIGNAGRVVVNTDGPGAPEMSFSIGTAPTANAALQLPVTMKLTEAALSAPGVEGVWIASQPEAEAGTSNSKIMTPLRVRQALDAGVMSRIAQASAGAVGTYAILSRKTSDGGPLLAYGTIYPGGSLAPVGFGRAGDGVISYPGPPAGSMSGSWRCLGDQTNSGSNAGTALFVRIA